MNPITISKGNTKLGRIPSVSGLPGRDCAPGVPCLGTCYARKGQCKFAHPKWRRNGDVLRTDPDSYFAQLRAFLHKRRPAFFRFHVGGDFLSQSHLDRAFALAREFPDVKFLAFTKRHEFDFTLRPSNFSIVASMWPGMPLPAGSAASLPKAWYLPIPKIGGLIEYRLRPAGTLECPGNCTDCGACWNLPALGRDVQFHQH